MQIIAISPSRQANQVWLKFDDQSFVPLKIDDIVVLKLKKFVDLSPDLYQQILISSASFIFVEYALRQIAISPKTELILTQKLKQLSHKLVIKYKFDSSLLDSLIKPTLDKIKSLNLLDEQKYIDYLIRKYPKKSLTELNFKLKSLGISYSIPISSSEEIIKIKDIISRKYKSADLSDYKAKTKVISSLYRKGFALEFIKTAIDECLHIR